MVHYIFSQILTGVTFTVLANLLRCSLSNDLATVDATVGSQIDDPIGDLDDIHVVFDDQDGIAVVNQSLQDLDQFMDVSRVQTNRRLIQDIKRPARGDAEALCQLDALRFAAGKGRAGCPRRI